MSVVGPVSVGHTGSPASRIGYFPGLDGLRALAVAAVFAYHADARWAPGGFLGVDIFFVISGYLITALLLAEWRRNGRVNIVEFWRRRALRLLPALTVMVVTVALATPILAPEQSGRLTGDIRAALAYVSNWRLIFEHQSYFEAAGRPPLLQHLWSLAVEEQFYLLWPLILPFVLRRRTLPRQLVGYLMGAAVASSLLMALLYAPSADPSRAYYGTDTRLAAILVGAALASVWAPWRVPRQTVRSAGIFLKTLLLASVAGLGLAVTHVDRYSSGLYRGGFLGVALLTAVAVAVMVHPAGMPFGSVLASRPLVWIGRRSYGIYLWHWPVLSVTRAGLDVPLDGFALLGLQAAVTVGLAATSYRFVEAPIRSGALGRLWSDLHRTSWTRTGSRQSVVLRGLALTAVVVILIGVATVSRTGSATDLAAASVISSPASVGDVNLAPIPGTDIALPAPTDAPIISPVPTPPDTATVATAPAIDPLIAPATVDPTLVTTTTTAAPEVAPAAPTPAAIPVIAIGDSVLLAAKPTLEASVPGIYVDAVIGRQIKSFIEVAQALKDGGQLGPTVVVQAGNNGPVSVGDLNRLLDVLADVPKVLVVTVEVPRPWESSNNEHMADVVAERSNAKLVDWHKEANAADGIFYKDGTHLRPAGIALYCRLVRESL